MVQTIDSLKLKQGAPIDSQCIVCLLSAHTPNPEPDLTPHPSPPLPVNQVCESDHKPVVLDLDLTVPSYIQVGVDCST